jgi:hypothetical protein
MNRTNTATTMHTHTYINRTTRQHTRWKHEVDKGKRLHKASTSSKLSHAAQARKQPRHRPNPVTSVHAVAPCSRRQSAAFRLEVHIDSSAAATHAPGTSIRISAANMVPAHSRIEPVVGGEPPFCALPHG